MKLHTKPHIKQRVPFKSHLGACRPIQRDWKAKKFPTKTSHEPGRHTNTTYQTHTVLLEVQNIRRTQETTRIGHSRTQQWANYMAEPCRCRYKEKLKNKTVRKANEAIERERHIIPKLQDITIELHHATYWQKNHVTSQHITHEDIFRYKRLFYGVNSGFEAFQKKIEIVLIDQFERLKEHLR